MISGSCDTEDWSNDANNSALNHRNYILKYIQIENKYYYYCIFDQIAALVRSITDLKKFFLKITNYECN